MTTLQLYTEHEGVYLVNDPEYCDEKGNSNDTNDVDGLKQGVECGIPLQAGTQKSYHLVSFQ